MSEENNTISKINKNRTVSKKQAVREALLLGDSNQVKEAMLSYYRSVEFYKRKKTSIFD